MVISCISNRIFNWGQNVRSEGIYTKQNDATPGICPSDGDPESNRQRGPSDIHGALATSSDKTWSLELNKNFKDDPMSCHIPSGVEDSTAFEEYVGMHMSAQVSFWCCRTGFLIPCVNG